MTVQRHTILEYHCLVMHPDGRVTHRETRTSDWVTSRRAHRALMGTADCTRRLRNGDVFAPPADFEFSWQSDLSFRLRWQQVHPLSAVSSFAIDWNLAANAVFLMGSDEAPAEDRKSRNAAANLLAYNGLTWNETVWSSLLEVPERPAIVAIPHPSRPTPKRWQQIVDVAECLGTKFFHRIIIGPESTHTWN